jgi:stage III sporulation protein AG
MEEKQRGPDVKSFWSRITEDEKKRKAILVCGFLLIGIIFLLSVLPKKEEKKNTTAQEISTVVTMEEYELKLENKLKKAIQNIKGVGKATVFLTLENGEETVYQSDTRQNTDKSVQSGGEGQYREELDQEIVLIEDENGRKQALVQTKRPPAVQGVVIVCEGASDISVQKAVTEAVSALFSIRSTQVAVVEYAPGAEID